MSLCLRAYSCLRVPTKSFTVSARSPVSPTSPYKRIKVLMMSLLRSIYTFRIQSCTTCHNYTQGRPLLAKKTNMSTKFKLRGPISCLMNSTSTILVSRCWYRTTTCRDTATGSTCKRWSRSTVWQHQKPTTTTMSSPTSSLRRRWSSGSTPSMVRRASQKVTWITSRAWSVWRSTAVPESASFTSPSTASHWGRGAPTSAHLSAEFSSKTSSQSSWCVSSEWRHCAHSLQKTASQPKTTTCGLLDQWTKIRTAWTRSLKDLMSCISLELRELATKLSTCLTKRLTSMLT